MISMNGAAGGNFSPSNAGDQAAKVGNHALAINCYTKALSLVPEDAFTHYKLGNSYVAIGAYKQATDEFDNALRYNPTLHCAQQAKDCLIHTSLRYYHEGNELVTRGDVSSAVEAYRCSLAFNSKQTESHLALAGIYEKMPDKVVTAIEHYNQAVLMGCENAALYYYKIARLWGEFGATERALESYKKTIELTPDFYAAHNNIGNILVTQKRYDEALASYNKALELAPESELIIGNIERLTKFIEEIRKPSHTYVSEYDEIQAILKNTSISRLSDPIEENNSEILGDITTIYPSFYHS